VDVGRRTYGFGLSVSHKDMTPEAKEYAKRIRDAFFGGNDRAIMELYREIQDNQDLVMEVWGNFPASMRSQLKEIISRD
jgi:hypothetical protein